VRTRLSLAVATVAALAVVVPAVVVSAPAARRAAPAIGVEATSSGLTVAGRSFLPHERVTLRATFQGGSAARTVTASTKGRFWTSLASRSNTTCGGVSVTATGSRGSKASYYQRSIPEPCGIDVGP